MSETKSSFGDEVKRISDEVMTDGTVEDILRERLTAGIKSAVDNSFRWGDIKDAIEARVKEVMVPYIEQYDMSKYVVKLDEVLSQIIDNSALVENKELLSNFKDLMIEPEAKTVTLESLFDAYGKLVAKDADVSNLDIEEGTYNGITTYAEISHQDDGTSWHWAMLKFWAEDQDDLEFSVRLHRWDNEKEDGYTISYDVEPNLERLRYLNEFELMLIRLSRCRARLTWDDEDLEDYINPDAEPELGYVN